MSLIDKTLLIFYRIAEKGLEVALVKNHSDLMQEKIVEATDKIIDQDPIRMNGFDDIIELQTIETQEEKLNAIAINSDAFDMPTLRELLKEDVYFLAKKIKSMLPLKIENKFISIKEAFKSGVFSETKALKELKEIIADRNITNNI